MKAATGKSSKLQRAPTKKVKATSSRKAPKAPKKRPKPPRKNHKEEVAANDIKPPGNMSMQGEVGIRGLLVRSLDQKTYRYFPDNKNASWTQFEVTEDTLPEHRTLSWAYVEKLTASRAPVALCTTKPRTFLINLDAFRSLKKPTRPQLAPQKVEVEDEEDLYVMHEEGKYYAVPAGKLKELSALDATYAQALVARGVVAAALPANQLPVGTHCVLLNLPEFVP